MNLLPRRMDRESGERSPCRENGFTYHPISEVAILFAGIFATMIPALLILKACGGELGVSQPWHFFWAAGALSSFLDNAPNFMVKAISESSGVRMPSFLGYMGYSGVILLPVFGAVTLLLL